MFRSNAVTYMLGCWAMGLYMHQLGRETAIMIGMILNLLQQVGLYFSLGI